MQVSDMHKPRVQQLLEALAVNLHVEFSAISLSARDLLSLHLGQLIPIQFDPEQIVTLLLDRQEIAKAKLRASEEGLYLEIQEVIA